MDRCGRAATAALLTVLAACGTQAPSQGQPDASRRRRVPGRRVPGRSVPPALATDIDRIRDHLAALQAIADEHGGVRVVGSAGYDASVDYAAADLREIGFERDHARGGVSPAFVSFPAASSRSGSGPFTRQTTSML